MSDTIAQVAEKCPYLNKQGIYISASKESRLLLLNLNTGSVNHLGPVEDSIDCKVDSPADTCRANNSTGCKNSSTSLTLPTYGQSSLWLVLTRYHLDALELSLGLPLWKIKYAELKDISSIDTEWKLPRHYLEYDLVNVEPLKLQARSTNFRRSADIKWEFTTSAPIMGAYQIIKGKYLAKLKLNEKLTMNPKNLKLYSFQKIVFGTYDWTDKYIAQSGPSTLIAERIEFDETVVPLIHHTALDIMRENTIKKTLDMKFLKTRNDKIFAKSKEQTNLSLWIATCTMMLLILSAMLYRRRRSSSKKPHIEPKVENKNVVNKASINTLMRPNALNKHVVGQLTIYANKILGYGSMGTIVYKGSFANRSVAVKRLLRAFNTIATKEISMLIASDNHPHVIQYFSKEEDTEFIYIALEKCAGSLDQLIEQSAKEGKSSRISKLFTSKEINTDLLINLFRESLEGLKFLHANKIVHRDLKPQNILISKRKKAKISDMGLCKLLTNIEKSFETNATGTWGWQPAEVLFKKKQHSSIDIFSMGCILYYILTGGKHPFGDKFCRESNILQGKYDLSELIKKDYIAAHLTDHMISSNPKLRPTVENCLKHLLFWDYEKRLNFLCEVSNRLEYDYGVNQTKGKLVQGFELISQKLRLLAHCNGRWDKRIDKFIVVELANHKKRYNYSSSTDLIRVYLYVTN